MELLIDTSAFYAALAAEDKNHSKAVAQFRLLEGTQGRLVTTSTIMVESVSLIQARLGLKAVEAFCSALLPLARMIWLSESQVLGALDLLRAQGPRGVSLTDQTSFCLMEERGLNTAFTFDSHFSERGFKVLPGI